MSEEKKDLKPGGEQPPAGSGQDDKDKKSTEQSKDDTVQISKSELEQIKKDRDNYREGVIASKRKGRTIPGSEPQVKKDKPANDGGDAGDDDDSQEFVTKKDFTKNIEKSAIKEAQKDSEVDENWDSIMEFYQPRHGKDTVDDILADIQTAKKVWKAENPTAPKTDKGEGDSKVAADLAADKGIGEGKDKKPTPEKKSILRNKKVPMKDWY
ncbi:MAG: hypothetical protein NT155_03685 [Candidatus Staskawiczbacteria bacterium]|nr:hypothetical protein [Candidatus Staskawiczbacteria bacterium]